MANLNIKLVKSLNGRLESRLPLQIPWVCAKSVMSLCSPTTIPPVARLPRSAICCRSLK